MTRTPFRCQWCNEPKRSVVIEPDCGLWLCNDCFEYHYRLLMWFDTVYARSWR